MRVTLQKYKNNRWLKKPVLAYGYQHWLIDNASLTLRLKLRHPKFRVKPVSVRYAKALTDEQAILNLKRDQKSLVREVVLISNNQPLVFAHSVLPKSSLRGDWHGFGRLGSKPLGEALFANPKVQRTSFRFKKLSRQHPLYKEAIQYSECSSEYLWARRSVFSLNCVSILVTEIFLPRILEK
ncbi:MAG: chorismate--pyruvate lyase family protein [Methylophilaceae bacterium]